MSTSTSSTARTPQSNSSGGSSGPNQIEEPSLRHRVVGSSKQNHSTPDIDREHSPSPSPSDSSRSSSGTRTDTSAASASSTTDGSIVEIRQDQEQQNTDSSRSSSLSNNNRDTSRPSSPNARNQVGLLSLTGILRIISFPAYFLYDSVWSILRFVWNLIRPDPRRIVTDPVLDVLQFTEAFESKYGERHPPFYPGSYSQALNEAKKELRFVLVYLHSESSRDTDAFCNQVLLSAEFNSFILQNNILVWACTIQAPEGYRVSQALRERSYPFLALIVLKEGRMTIVGKFDGSETLLNLNRLIRMLQRCIDNNETALVAARLERQELQMNQIIRQEQDKAYELSLKADQEKERKRREEEEKKKAEEQARRDEEEQAKREKERLLELRKKLISHIPAEPPVDHPDTIKLMVKLPSGTRLERRFLKTQSIKHLYTFVFCHQEAPFKFQVTANFPKRTLPGSSPAVDPIYQVNDAINHDVDMDVDDQGLTFADVGIGKSEMLLVIDLEA